jgi:hypothetical protein
MGLVFGVSGLYNLVTNIYSGDCKDSVLYCLPDYVSIMAIQNKKDHPDLIQGQLIVNLITVIAMLGYFHFIRYKFKKTSDFADKNLITPSDYTVMLRHMPNGVTYEDIVKWINDQGDKNHKIDIKKVRRINRAFNIIEYNEKYSRIAELKKKLEEPKLAIAKKNKYTEELKKLEERVKLLRHETLKFTNTAFVTFKSEEITDFILKKFKKTILRRTIEFLLPFLNKQRFNGKRTSVQKAPEPNDIKWVNLCYKTPLLIKLRMYTLFMAVLLISASFGMVLGINVLQVN